KTKEIDPLGHATVTEYDGRGNVAKMVAPDGAVTTIENDLAWNLPVRVIDPLGHQWGLTYDPYGQVLEQRLPSGEVMRFSWEQGLLRTVTDAEGRTARIAYDEAKNPERVQLPNGGELVYRTDGRGTMYKT